MMAKEPDTIVVVTLGGRHFPLLGLTSTQLRVTR